MSSYLPKPVIRVNALDLNTEFQKISQALLEPEFVAVQMQNQREEPPKPIDGMVVYTDASAWDPGLGAGFYGRVLGVWEKL